MLRSERLRFPALSENGRRKMAGAPRGRAMECGRVRLAKLHLGAASKFNTVVSRQPAETGEATFFFV